MERLFEFLFKHKPIVFSKGDLTFAANVSGGWVWVLSVSLLAGVSWLYFRMTPALPLKTKTGLASIRLGIFGLILFCLLQPVMRIPTVVPQRSFVAVLVDDSQSMGIADEADGRRLDVVRKLLAQDNRFHQQLEEKFKVRRYAFSSVPTRAETVSELTASGDGTNLAAAIEMAMSDLQSLPLSAIVVMSDGASNIPSDFSPLINKLKANRVPLYVLGLGREELEHDIELVKVDAPRTILQGSSISATLMLRGHQARRVRVNVLEDQRVVKSQTVELRSDGEAQAVPVEFTPTGSGLKHYVFAVEPSPGELINENNQRDLVVMVRDEHPKILYVEGEPRWEYGKLRMALRDEKNVILSSLLRTAKNKYYRQGIETPDELVKGFPQTREELFAYKGVVFGSVEASFFSFDQLKNMEAFVAERGGGFLMLGGRHAFSMGGYATTPIADLLPVTLTEAAANPTSVTVKPTLTLNGKLHPITQLSDEPGAGTQMWEKLPALTVPEPLTRIKPGAVVLLEGRSARNQPLALLAYQRYGRGRSLAFTAADSWRWQMQMPSENQSHERFWKQLLRYLVNASPDQVMVTTDSDASNISDPVRIRAEVNSRAFIPITDATVAARIGLPGGKQEEIPLQWTEEKGAYVGQIVARENGVHTIEVVARKGDETIGVAQAGFIVGDLNREYYDAQQHAEFLRHLTEETGGRYYTSKTAERLPEEITYLDNQSAMRVTKELWDMPINFLLLIGLVSAEWLLRRRKGLP
ncbi:MAG: VWA domain-containing protein [Acidobacteria bacterium]|nr:VWA domain-containing protein [Acidobacteriota bacterium]